MLFGILLLIGIGTRVETFRGKQYFFMDCKDYPNGAFWQTFQQSGADLNKFEQAMNCTGTFIETPDKEAKKALGKVTDNNIKRIMTKDIENTNWMSALVLYLDAVGKEQE